MQPLGIWKDISHVGAHSAAGGLRTIIIKCPLGAFLLSKLKIDLISVISLVLILWDMEIDQFCSANFVAFTSLMVKLFMLDTPLVQKSP